jgi:hypothetical protein
MKMAKPVSVLLAMVLCLALLPVTPARAETDAQALLNSIDLLARQGWILNCGYRVENNTVDDVTDDIGKPDESTYVASAKGTYATFDDDHIVVGFNKGDQIFELRSYDARLGSVRLNDVKAYYGKPDHTASGNGEQYLSYKLSDKLNIKFVFPSSGKNPALSHYNVLWPQGTVNMMADDPGRTW